MPVWWRALQVAQGYRGAKSHYTYVWVYFSVTESPIEIIFSSMTCCYHLFEEYTKSNNNAVNFFQMNVHFHVF